MLIDVAPATLTAFARRDDIDLAYPTTRMYFNAREGKEATRPKETALATPPGPGDGLLD